MVEKYVFVTVGTLEFDLLIQTVLRRAVLKKLQESGYNKLLLQIGKGRTEPSEYKNDEFEIEFYRYKPSLKKDIENASLVISHAGAGCILETLEAKKPLLVVINEELMGNHQIELAYQMHKDGHLYYCTCNTLEEELESLDFSALKHYNPGNPQLFADYLDSLVD